MCGITFKVTCSEHALEVDVTFVTKYTAVYQALQETTSRNVRRSASNLNLGRPISCELFLGFDFFLFGCFFETVRYSPHQANCPQKTPVPPVLVVLGSHMKFINLRRNPLGDPLGETPWEKSQEVQSDYTWLLLWTAPNISIVCLFL